MMGTMTATTRYDHYISLKNINMNRFYFSDAFMSVSRPTGFQLVFVLLPVVFLTSQGSIQVSQHEFHLSPHLCSIVGFILL